MYIRLYPNSTKVMTLAPKDLDGEMIYTESAEPTPELPEGMDYAELHFKDVTGNGVPELTFEYHKYPTEPETDTDTEPTN